MTDPRFDVAMAQFVGAINSIVAVVCHTAVGATIVVSAWAIDSLIHLLWHDKEPMILDRVPLHWITEASEIGLFVAFVVWGTISAVKAFRE